MNPDELIARFDAALDRAEKKAGSFDSEVFQGAVAELERLSQALQTCSFSRSQLEHVRERTRRYHNLVSYLHDLLYNAVRSVVQPSDGCYSGQGGIAHRHSHALVERYG